MKRFVFTISFFWAGVFVSCQKDALKPVDDVCSVMDDDAFKEYCLKSFDSDGDGILSMEEAAAVELIRINNSPNLVSLKGIEYFTKLTDLSCGGNQLASLDVTKNGQLTSLSCGFNQLTSLDVSKNTKLTSCICNPQTGGTITVTGWTGKTTIF